MYRSCKLISVHSTNFWVLHFRDQFDTLTTMTAFIFLYKNVIRLMQNNIYEPVDSLFQLRVP